MPVAEIENLLLDEDFLRLAAREFKVVDEKAVDNIKQDIMEKFEKDLELQVSKYVSAKIDYYFKDSNVKEGKTLDKVTKNYKCFTDEIKISDWGLQRKETLEGIIANKDYSKVLAVYNNKGLKAIVNRHFKIKDFTDRAIKFLQSDEKAREIIRKYFPKDLKGQDNAVN